MQIHVELVLSATPYLFPLITYQPDHDLSISDFPINLSPVWILGQIWPTSDW